MFNSEKFDSIISEWRRASKEAGNALYVLYQAKDLKGRILLWGFLLFAIAFGVAAILLYPGVSEFGDFFFTLVILSASLFFLLFQILMNRRIDKINERYEKALAIEEEAQDACFHYIASCLNK
jgi:hypothetical protein